jgi:two-component system, cell cycle sensor histidine kinase and response regulator CckA
MRAGATEDSSAFDPTERLVARLVRQVIDLIIFASLAFAGFSILGRAGLRPIEACTVSTGVVVLGLLRVAVVRGHVRLAAFALSAVGWVAITMDVLARGPNTVAVGAFVVLIVIAGLASGPVAASAVAAATAMLLSLVLTHVIGNHPFPEPSDAARLTQYLTQVALATVLVAWWSIRMRRLISDLRESEARRALILEESPDSIVTTDNEGIVTYQNRATELILGLASSDVVGKPWRAIPGFTPHDAVLLGDRFAEAILGKTLSPAEFTFTRKDNHEVVIEARCAPLREGGQVVGCISLVRDVTLRRRAEAERALLQERLLAAQRLEAMGRVTGGVAHDFNNMLAVILCAAESLERGHLRDPSALADIKEATRKGVALSRQLLAFSRRQPVQPRRVDTNRSLTALRPILGRLVGERTSIEMRLAESLPVVMIDPWQLDQVWVNLVVNARDAMPQGGTLTFETSFAPPTGGDVGAGRVEITVRDTGTGMTTETAARIFEPFFTTKGERGTGLGLSVVYGIIQQAEGTIVCESALGQGSMFKVSLPASRGKAEAPTETLQGAPLESSRRRLLYVDDDRLVRHAVTQMLERAGFAVDGVATASNIADVQLRLDDADALVTDVAMPGVSGLDLVEALRRNGVTKPVVFVSGSVDESLLDRIRAVPGTAFVSKPFSADDIARRLDQLVEG